MTVIVVVLLAFLFLYIAFYGYRNGVIKRDIPGSYAARRLEGDEARCHGWVVVTLGISAFVMLIVMVMIAHYRMAGR